ncbi:two-component system chemotaxis response regulator CheB [Melghiribacillus thermohalophilus]|uniref:Protein-glutamate methylesterase/protein-glutamine glutaminase n=1 Tax=Melghiribacillus thermohalophilus TaxID=1324956 RepID=A0A4R3NHI9_9BACI|nr:chemotaxis response regulator protein-glutamate methylesterase [Melghiribacillus thermohalophilus]TCT26752.1 two-component system chemotaxis response regulator CheB [Melghiribacillus thermohalophilus]
MNRIKVLVVDDSAFMRKMISDILNSDPFIEVIGTARNGKDGIDKMEKLSPDVITLDIEMPIMDGLTALKNIMDRNPLPVVMLSSLTQEGAETTLKALQFGAVDFIQKPSGPISLDIEKIKESIVRKVREAASANIASMSKGNELTEPPSPLPLTVQTKANKENRKTIVAIGVSTGGPRALQQVLTQLPADFPAPLVIVQHMPPKFTKSLAERLDKLSAITIKEAEHGELLQKGTAYIAPGDFHMKVKKIGMSLAANITKDQPIRGHRPSVDALFESISTLHGYKKILVVLTGMGSDGTHGMQVVKQEDPGTIAIAEASETSVVFGMPKSAIQTGLVNQVSPIQDISQSILKAMEN